jgi:hypothetical protein
MTTQKAVDILNILQDKYGSPNVDSTEAVDLLNMGMYEWLNRLIPSNLGGAVNYELDENTLANIKPLVFGITVNMSGSGVLTNAAITTALQSAGAPTGSTWYRIGNMGITISGNLYPIKFSTHNNIVSYARNFFKKGTATRIKYTIRQDGLKFNYVDSSNTISAVIVKNPRLLSIGNSPELDDQNMYNIISIALKFAGVATRDEELIMDVRNTAIQIAQ